MQQKYKRPKIIQLQLEETYANILKIVDLKGILP